jgi:hypothetical protein
MLVDSLSKEPNGWWLYFLTGASSVFLVYIIHVHGRVANYTLFIRCTLESVFWWSIATAIIISTATITILVLIGH